MTPLESKICQDFDDDKIMLISTEGSASCVMQWGPTLSLKCEADSRSEVHQQLYQLALRLQQYFPGMCCTFISLMEVLWAISMTVLCAGCIDGCVPWSCGLCLLD